MAEAAAIPFILQQAGLSATPLLFAGFGELVAQRAGVINIGIEGTMLAGALAGYAAALLAENAGAALPAAIGAGLLVATLFALASVWFRADQIVAGTAINILCAGGTTTASRMLDEYGRTHAAPELFKRLPADRITWLPSGVTEVLSQYPLFYLAIPLAVGLYCVLRYTRYGLVVRGLGDAPDACHAAGIGVRMHRTVLILFAGALAGVAGAYLSTMRTHGFQLNMTSGRGFLVLALVIFGRWNVAGLVAGIFVFSLMDGITAHLVSKQSAGMIKHALDMIPYVATLVALTVMARSGAGPIYLGRAWPE
jgi:general nucleoside transport system permease protein